MKMTNRELETRYMHMKQTWKTLVDANVNLVDENKDLKEEIERLNNIIDKAIEYINVNTNKGIYESGYGRGTALTICKEHLLEILDKEGK